MVAVKVARAELAEVRLTVTAPATVFPREQANISSRITAHIRELRARKGDTVAAGQVLAVLENRDILAQRDEARAALADAQANLQKISTGTLPTDVEKARGQVVSAEAALSQAQKNHTRRSELYKQGAIPGRDLLASETDLKQAQASFDVAKRTLDLLEHQSRDQDIRIAESQVEQVKAKLANVDVQLQFAEIRSPFAGSLVRDFQRRKEASGRRLTIPAVQFSEGTRSGSAYVVDAKQVAHKVEVETGERSQGNVQITKGLSAGDLVIVEGGYGLPDGTQVRSSEAGK